jgi:leader peptidase (prepilin peptidase)/N-methyltransferase
VIKVRQVAALNRREVLVAVMTSIGVEILLGWRIGMNAVLPAFLCLGAFGIAISICDLQTRRIPNPLVLTTFVCGVSLLSVASASDGDWWRLGRGVVAMVAVSGIYGAIALAMSSQFGMGDVKLGGVLALFLGWLSWQAVFNGALLGWMLAAVVLFACRLPWIATRTHRVPMAPFLCAGCLLTVLTTRA